MSVMGWLRNRIDRERITARMMIKTASGEREVGVPLRIVDGKGVIEFKAKEECEPFMLRLTCNGFSQTRVLNGVNKMGRGDVMTLVGHDEPDIADDCPVLPGEIEP